MIVNREMSLIRDIKIEDSLMSNSFIEDLDKEIELSELDAALKNVKKN